MVINRDKFDDCTASSFRGVKTRRQQTDRHTERQTDRQTELRLQITLANKNFFVKTQRMLYRCGVKSGALSLKMHLVLPNCCSFGDIFTFIFIILLEQGAFSCMRSFFNVIWFPIQSFVPVYSTQPICIWICTKSHNILLHRLSYSF